MNDETALVDEIVRRVLQQLPGVQLALRHDVRIGPESPGGLPASRDLASGEQNAGRMLAPPTSCESAGPAASAVPATPVARPSSTAPPVPATGPAALVSSLVALPSAAAAEVVIGERIITAEVLLRHLNGARRIRVSAKSLLTPSANDVVRSRKLEVVRDRSPGRSGDRAQRRWLIVRTQPLVGLEVALENWRGAGTAVESRLAGDHAEGATLAISAICRGEADEVLLLTAEPEWSACLVNRNDRVRGAAVADTAAIGRLRDSLKPNVWTCSGAKRGAFELTSLFQALDR